jgi:hypothetical protein
MSEQTTEKIPRTEGIRCESCGEKFACGAKKENCWCFAVEITPETLAKLNQQFRHCLCPQCLNKSSA